MMILLSLRIYTGYDVIKNDKNKPPEILDSANNFTANIIKLSKVFTTEEFKDADVLTRSMMIKEKELELNHD